MEIPVVSSPSNMLLWIGAAPLHLGNMDAWTLTAPHEGILKTSAGRINPYATTNITSGLIFYIASISEDEKLSGQIIFNFFSSANL